jgi:hypothetical protein
MKDLIKKILKENDDLSWMDGVSDKPLPMNDRTKVKFSELFESKLRSMDNPQHKQNMIEYLDGEGVLEYNQEEDVYVWVEEPSMYDYEQRDFIGWRFETPEWRLVAEETVDYELEYQQSTELVVFERKSDSRFFGYEYIHYLHDGPEDIDDQLTEMFKKRVTKEVWF